MHAEAATPVAMVQRMEVIVPRHADPMIADLQSRAERAVREYSDHEVEMYELERAMTRAKSGYEPVPVTTRGLKVLTGKQYAVTAEGYLTLG